MSKSVLQTIRHLPLTDENVIKIGDEFSGPDIMEALPVFRSSVDAFDYGDHTVEDAVLFLSKAYKSRGARIDRIITLRNSILNTREELDRPVESLVAFLYNAYKARKARITTLQRNILSTQEELDTLENVVVLYPFIKDE